MNSRILMIACVFFLINKTIAQSPFAQTSQLPILLNPSLAGSKDKKRISAGVNMVRSFNDENHNYALSYDQKINKLKSGLGIYYLNQRYSFNQLDDVSWLALDDLNTKNSNQLGGICIAPKFSINNKKDISKVKLTFSPSLFIEYGKSINSKAYNTSGEYFNNYYDSILKYKIDTTYFNYNMYQYNNNYLIYGLGFEANTAKFIFLAKFPFVINNYSERIINSNIHTTNEVITSSSENTISKFSSRLYSFEPTIHIGYSFSTNSSSKFSFTPLIGIGKKYYFNIEPYLIDPNYRTYRYGISNNDATQFSYLHGSANFAYKNFSIGAAYTQLNTYIYKGITVGFQNEHVKITCTTGLNTVKSFTEFHSIEITTNVFF